jgi:stage V sporulation protein R
MNALELPFDMQMEFLKLHNRIVQPSSGTVNPYALGFAIWQDLEGRMGLEELFSVMEANRDVSFVRQFLTRDIMERLHMFAYKKKGASEVVIKEVADEKGWKDVREELIRWVGVNSLPVIKIVDVEPDGMLVLKYFGDGRKLDPEYKEHTLRYVELLWGNRVKMLEAPVAKVS